MFVVGTERRAWWPVEWQGAAEDGGGLIDNRIELQFRLLDVDQLTVWQEKAQAAEREPEGDAQPAPRSERYAAVIADIASNWKGVGQENAEPLPWSEANLARLLGVPGLYLIVVQAYAECVGSRAKVREGN